MRRARDGEAGPLWIAAHEQTKGRGRQGRAWLSPQGNLAASLLLVDPCPVALAPQLGFVAGLAILRAVHGLGPAGRAARLKWPNDLVVDGAKLSGLLLEGTQLADGRFACVIGFGINIVACPADLPYAAISLADLGLASDAQDFLAQLSESMDYWLALWARGDRFAEVRAAWQEQAAGRDQTIRLVSGGRDLLGIFRGIDAAGQLVLETKSGPETIAAGDVFLLGDAGRQEKGE